MTLINRFVVCLDSSGSMQSFQKDTVKAFNMNVKAIRDGAEAAGQVSTVGLITFSGQNSYGANDYRVEEKAFDAKLDIAMRDSDFKPDGGTPMLDAVGKAIERLRSLPDSLQTSYVIMAFTDGEENSSQYYTWDKLLRLIGEVNGTDRWTFAWSVPRGKGRALIARGIPAGNVQEWDLTARGLEDAAANLAQATSQFYQSRSAGIRSSKSFFAVDAAAIKPQDVKANARDIKGEVKTWEVPKEIDIKTFVESKGIPYMRGRAFYQLTKKEKIQYDKELLLQEKGKTAVYQGDSVRDMLGLDKFKDTDVAPGNFGFWDIFVQSASTNRKLVRGTKLMYLK